MCVHNKYMNKYIVNIFDAVHHLQHLAVLADFDVLVMVNRKYYAQTHT